jgi:hypothetical protein
MVMPSANAWQGCSTGQEALMRGTVARSAAFSSDGRVIARCAIASTYRSIVMMVSGQSSSAARPTHMRCSLR